MRVALVQLCSSDQPSDNLVTTEEFIRAAATSGATFILTPEVSNIISKSRAHQGRVLCSESDDKTLARLREVAAELEIWLLIGSLAVLSNDPDGRFANRSFLIAPDGGIAARYDKIHMFDVEISPTETWRESEGYRPGSALVMAKTTLANIGLTICYDLRFPHLYRALAKAGAKIITVPAAFSPITGAAHWHVLLRARAIETGCFILAPAQCGTHDIEVGKPRSTYGHSLAISPWGEVLADGGTEPGVTLVDLDLAEVASARKRIPSLDHDRAFEREK